MGKVRVDGGNCLCLYALRVGDYIDLTKVREMKRNSDYELVADDTPGFFKESIHPLLLRQPSRPRQFGNFETLPEVMFAIYPFGVISVKFTIPLKGELADLVDLSFELEKSEELENHASELVVRLLEGLQETISDINISQEMEDYWVFCFGGDDDVEEIAEQDAALVGKILNSEKSELSAQLIGKVRKDLVAYTKNVGVFTNWAAALVVDAKPQDVLAVIEVANAMSVVLDFIDAHLDMTLSELKGVDPTQVMRIPEVRAGKRLHAEYASMLSLLSEPLKLVRDQYLARVFERLSALHHDGLLESIRESFAAIDAYWDTAIEAQNSLSTRWAEGMIIALIVIEILLSLFRH